MIRCPLAKQQQTDSLSHLLLVGSVEDVVQIPENDFFSGCLAYFRKQSITALTLRSPGKKRAPPLTSRIAMNEGITQRGMKKL